MKNIPYEKTYINITLRRHMITIISPKKKHALTTITGLERGETINAKRSSVVKERKRGGGALTGKLNEMEDIYIPSF